MPMRRRSLLASSLLLPAMPGLAQDRPVTLVVPYATGGTIDVLARALAGPLGQALAQPVVIDTRPGAGGNVGAAYVAQQSRPDGQTILFTGPALATSVSMSHLPFDPLRELFPLLGVGAIPSLVVVSPASPYASLSELLAAARVRPGSITYGSSGPATGSHLGGALLAQAAGVELTHVPYRGAAAVYPDLIAQRIAMLAEIMAGSSGPVRQGTVRALAITSARRSAVLPEVPTVSEAAVPGFEFGSWVGLFVRAGAPSETLRRIEAAALAALASAPMQEALRLSGSEPIAADMAGFGAYFRADVERWASMVRAGVLSREPA